MRDLVASWSRPFEKSALFRVHTNVREPTTARGDIPANARKSRTHGMDAPRNRASRPGRHGGESRPASQHGEMTPGGLIASSSSSTGSTNGSDKDRRHSNLAPAPRRRSRTPNRGNSAAGPGATIVRSEPYVPLTCGHV